MSCRTVKKTNRKFDTKVEKEVAKFLDENLYSKDIFSRCETEPTTEKGSLEALI